MAFISTFQIRLNSAIYVNKISRRMSEMLPRSQNPGSKIQTFFFLQILMELKSFHQRRNASYKTVCQEKNRHNTHKCHDTHILPESKFKYKTTQGMEHVCPDVEVRPLSVTQTRHPNNLKVVLQCAMPKCKAPS